MAVHEHGNGQDNAYRALHQHGVDKARVDITGRNRQMVYVACASLFIASIVCVGVSSTSPSPPAAAERRSAGTRQSAFLVGGLGMPMPADSHVQSLCNGLRDDAQSNLQASGWNGIFTEFTALRYVKQAVAGTNYFVKVRVGDGQFIHMRIYEPLPNSHGSAELSAVKLATEEEPLVYFESNPQAMGNQFKAIASPSLLVGSLSAPRKPDAFVETLCNGLRDDAQSELTASGWTGSFTEFTVVLYATQVVAGTNYFVKVRIGNGHFIHMRIYEPLPNDHKNAEVSAVKLATEEEPLVYFESNPQAMGNQFEAIASPSLLVGGLSAPRQPDAFVQTLCNGLRDDAQSALTTSGWTGSFTEFTAALYATQVVAGTNYFVKVRVGAHQFVHLRIYEPLPYTHEKPELSAIKSATESEPLSYFEGPQPL